MFPNICIECTHSRQLTVEVRGRSKVWGGDAHLSHHTSVEVRGQLTLESVPSFHHVGSGKQTQVIRHSGKHLYLLSLLDSLNYNFKRPSGGKLSFVFVWLSSLKLTFQVRTLATGGTVQSNVCALGVLCSLTDDNLF